MLGSIFWLTALGMPQWKTYDLSKSLSIGREFQVEKGKGWYEQSGEEGEGSVYSLLELNGI